MGNNLNSFIKGGGQEFGKRSGTENLMNIQGFAQSIEDRLFEINSGKWDEIKSNRNYLEEMILNEINILWTRYQNAVHGTHTIESLSDITPPAAFQIDANNLRPDLAPLHDALLSCGTDGWRPLIAIRVGLMECIASAIEESLE